MATLRGGDKLEAALAKIAANVKKAAKVHVGILEGSTYPDGTSVGFVAVQNEFGNSTTPARPAFRDAVAAHSDEWPVTLGTVLVENNYDAAKALALMGEGIKGQIQQSIATFSGVPLKPATIKRKGSSKQLVDTGHELASVDYEVKS